MEDFKEGGKAWTAAVWTRTKLRNKVHVMISEVKITRLFPDDTCLVTDDEEVGIYCKLTDLFHTQQEALEDSFIGLNRWKCHEN